MENFSEDDWKTARRQARKGNREQDELVANMPYEDKVKFLKDHDWIMHPGEVDENDTDPIEGLDSDDINVRIEAMGRDLGRRFRAMDWWSLPEWDGTKVMTRQAMVIQLNKNKKAERERLKKRYEIPILCNKCGCDTRKTDHAPLTSDEEPQYWGYYGLVDAEVSGGYLSDDFHDGDVFTFSMCEKCLMELFNTFKTLPKVDSFI